MMRPVEDSQIQCDVACEHRRTTLAAGQTMKTRYALLVAALLSMHAYAVAQPATVNGIRLAEDVVPAPDGYETVTTKYMAAGPTDLYISPFIWAGKVLGVQLKAGQPVEILAKPKGYDWLLVGKNGAGIGYVPMSALSQAR